MSSTLFSAPDVVPEQVMSHLPARKADRLPSSEGQSADAATNAATTQIPQPVLWPALIILWANVNVPFYCLLNVVVKAFIL